MAIKRVREAISHHLPVLMQLGRDPGDNRLGDYIVSYLLGVHANIAKHAKSMHGSVDFSVSAHEIVVIV